MFRREFLKILGLAGGTWVLGDWFHLAPAVARPVADHGLVLQQWVGGDPAMITGLHGGKDETMGSGVSVPGGVTELDLRGVVADVNGTYAHGTPFSASQIDRSFRWMMQTFPDSDLQHRLIVTDAPHTPLTIFCRLMPALVMGDPVAAVAFVGYPNHARIRKCNLREPQVKSANEAAAVRNISIAWQVTSGWSECLRVTQEYMAAELAEKLHLQADTAPGIAGVLGQLHQDMISRRKRFASCTMPIPRCS